MDIDNTLYLWVDEVGTFNDKIILDGVAFDGDYGYGSDEIKHYEGQMWNIGINSNQSDIGNISVMYTSRNGIKWAIDCSTSFVADLPFLLTSNSNMSHYYSGKIAISTDNQETEALHLIDKYNTKYPLPILSNNTLGVIINDHGFLTAHLYTNKTDIVFAYESFVFAEWDDVIIGKLGLTQ